MTKRKSDKPLEGGFISKDDPVYGVYRVHGLHKGDNVYLKDVSGIVPDDSDEVFFHSVYKERVEDITVTPVDLNSIDNFQDLIEEQGRRLARAIDEDILRKYMGETTDGPDFEKHGVFTVSDFYSIESGTSIGFEEDTEGDREPEEGCDDTENKDGDSQIQKGKKDV